MSSDIATLLKQVKYDELTQIVDSCCNVRLIENNCPIYKYNENTQHIKLVSKKYHTVDIDCWKIVCYLYTFARYNSMNIAINKNNIMQFVLCVENNPWCVCIDYDELKKLLEPKSNNILSLIGIVAIITLLIFIGNR